MHLRSEHPPLCGRDHLSFRSYYFPVKVGLCWKSELERGILAPCNLSFLWTSLSGKSEQSWLKEHQRSGLMGVSNGGEEWLVIFKDLFPQGRPQPEKRLPPVLLLWTQDTKDELRVVSLALKWFRYLRENKSFLCCCFSMPLPLSIWPISYSLFCVLECDRWRSLWAVQLHGAQQTEERLWRTGPNPTWGVQEAWGHPDPLCLLSPCFSCGTCVRDYSVSLPRGS